MKKILSLLAISFSLAFAYTAADVYGAWNLNGVWDANITPDNFFYQLASEKLLLFSKGDLDEGNWRFNNDRITYPNTNKYCILISAKIMDCQFGIGKTTYKKAANIVQVEQDLKRLKQGIDKQDSIKKLNERQFYIKLEWAKYELQQIYSEYKENIEKGEFESTSDFNKRKARIDKELKDSTEFYFNNALYSIVDEIENHTQFNFERTKYDADKQIFDVVFSRNGLNIGGKVKMPPEIAKNLKEDLSQFSFRYEEADLRNINYVLIPIKLSIYDKNKVEYKVNFDLPKTAKEIVFKGAELWKDNPHAKNLSVSLAEAIKRYAPVKEARAKAAEERAEAEKKAEEEKAEAKRKEEEAEEEKAEAERKAAVEAQKEEEARKAAAEAYRKQKAEEEAEEQRKKIEAMIKNGFTDSRDGKKYNVIKIDNQVWMAENLNYELTGSECYGNYCSIDSKCYDNKPENCKKYGRLYNWRGAMIACPSGWHLPSIKELKVLPDKSPKSIDIQGGYVNSYGSFLDGGKTGYWWTTDKEGDFAYYLYRRKGLKYSESHYDSRGTFRSVRCLLD